jgi:hypothetical protein
MKTASSAENTYFCVEGCLLDVLVYRLNGSKEYPEQHALAHAHSHAHSHAHPHIHRHLRAHLHTQHGSASGAAAQ